MLSDRSTWRANDAVANDAARESANTVIAVLLRLSDHGMLDSEEALAEVANLRRELLQLDGFDRNAVDSVRKRFDQRSAELANRLT